MFILGSLSIVKKIKVKSHSQSILQGPHLAGQIFISILWESNILQGYTLV